MRNKKLDEINRRIADLRAGVAHDSAEITRLNKELAALEAEMVGVALQHDEMVIDLSASGLEKLGDKS